jgi:endoglucanase
MKMRTLLLFVLSSVLIPARAQNTSPNNAEVVAGGIIRTDRTQKSIHLVFTGHEFGDGGETIRGVLKKHVIKGSFFLTGDFYRNPQYAGLISALKKDGHYLGAHSDKHLLYCSWEKRDSLLVTKEDFFRDVLDNYKEIERFGVRKTDARFFLPAYEWYNDTVTTWTKELGLVLVNFTPGTYSNADWTHPELGRQYVSSDTIFARILRFEQSRPDGLNGFILLTHIGTDPRRKDKFYMRLDELITALENKGYQFTLLAVSLH